MLATGAPRSTRLLRTASALALAICLLEHCCSALTSRGAVVAEALALQLRLLRVAGENRAQTQLTWMMMAFRPDDTSTSCADVMYKSRKSLFSSALVASRSKSACSGDTVREDSWLEIIAQTRRLPIAGT